MRVLPVETPRPDDPAIFSQAPKADLVIFLYVEGFIEPEPSVHEHPHAARLHIGLPVRRRYAPDPIAQIRCHIKQRRLFTNPVRLVQLPVIAAKRLNLDPALSLDVIVDEGNAPLAAVSRPVENPVTRPRDLGSRPAPRSRSASPTARSLHTRGVVPTPSPSE